MPDSIWRFLDAPVPTWLFILGGMILVGAVHSVDSATQKIVKAMGLDQREP